MKWKVETLYLEKLVSLAVTWSKFDPAERDPVKQQSGRRSIDSISLARQSTSVYLIKADVFPLSPGFQPIRINGEWHACVQVSISNLYSDLV